MTLPIRNRASQRDGPSERLSTVEADSADVIASPGTPLDRDGPAADATAPDARPDPARQVTELFREHHLELVRLALLMVGDLATAEDVVQDAFEQLHRRWRSLRKQSSALDYARSAVLNRCRSVLRRRLVAHKNEARIAVTARQEAGDADAATGTVAVPDTRGAQDWSVTAEADDRHFVIAAYLSMAILPGNAVFFGLPVSADGRPGQPERLRVALQGGLLTGMALSADGTMLALSQKYPVPLVMEPVYYGGIEVIDLATGKTRTWTGRGAEGYWPGTPSWGNGDRTLTFTWWHSTSLATAAADLVGIRELDTSAPGSNLLASRLVTFRAVTHGLQSAVITSGGREIIASSCGDADGYHGTAVARVVELSAADGHLLRLLWHQDVRFPNATDEMDAIVSACTLLSADPSGDHVLVQALRFGRIDNGVFTVLPGASPRVLFVAAAW